MTERQFRLLYKLFSSAIAGKTMIDMSANFLKEIVYSCTNKYHTAVLEEYFGNRFQWAIL